MNSNITIITFIVFFVLASANAQLSPFLSVEEMKSEIDFKSILQEDDT